MTSVQRVDPADFDWAAPDGVAAGMRAVLDAATAEDGAAPLDEAALLHLRHHGLDESALWVAGSGDGFAWLRDGDLDVVVRPGARRAGLGRELASAALAHASGPLAVWSHGNHPGAMVLARDLGFDRVRDLWVMRRGLPGELPSATVPQGVEIRAFRPGDEEAFLAVNAEAFAGHPEQGDLSRADLELRMAEPWFDPAGFFVAVSTAGDLLGFHWTKVHDGQPPVGEVYVVGVAPGAQGTGLGRGLTLAGLHHLAERGLTEVLLYVEADNKPAIGMYAALGFTHAAADTHVQYRRP